MFNCLIFKSVNIVSDDFLFISISSQNVFLTYDIPPFLLINNYIQKPEGKKEKEMMMVI